MPEPEYPSPDRFIVMAGVFEGGLALVAVALGWIVGIAPMDRLFWDLPSVAWGAAAAIPLLILFALAVYLPLAPLRRILNILEELVVPLFRPHGLLAIGIVCLLAGLGEEMLFRGVIQPAIAGAVGGQMGVVVGLVAASLLFGLAHAVTPTYAALASLIGLYMGWLWIYSGNLAVPIVAHAVYDLLAIVYLAKIRGASEPAEAPSGQQDAERSSLDD
jgi:hypothetical protein